MNLRHALAPLGLAAAIAGASLGPALAAPLHSAPAGIVNAAPQDVSSVQYRHRDRRSDRRHNWRARSWDRDNVGSIIRTPGAPYYAYNRFSGQYHRSCVIDLGYGRVQPCDAGGSR